MTSPPDEEFAWTDYKDVAKALEQVAGHSSTRPAKAEAYLRSALSRAYYAAFHAARDEYRRLMHDPDAEVPHDGLWKDVCSFPNYRNVALKTLGLTARRVRNVADYDLSLQDPDTERSVSAMELANVWLEQMYNLASRFRP